MKLSCVFAIILQTNRPTLADRSIKKSQKYGITVKNIDSTPQKYATVRRIFSAVPVTAVRLGRPRRDPLSVRQRPAKAYTAFTLVTRNLYSYFKMQETVCKLAFMIISVRAVFVNIFRKKGLVCRASGGRPIRF